LFEVVNSGDEHQVRLILAEENPPLSDAQTEIARASAQRLDIAVTGGCLPRQRCENSGSDETIESQQVACSRRAEFDAACHAAQRRRSSSNEMLSPGSANAASSRAAVSVSMISSSPSSESSAIAAGT